MTATNAYDALIIGGGLAGAFCARALSDRGRRVIITDIHSEPASEASGNPFALLNPYIRAFGHSSAYASVLDTAHHFSSEVLRTCSTDGVSDARTASLQMPSTHRIAKLIENGDSLAEWERCDNLSHEAAHCLATRGLIYRDTLLVRPRNLVREIISAPGIVFRGEHNVTELTRVNGGWNVSLAGGGSLSTPCVIVCCAHKAAAFPPVAHLGLEPVRGETMLLEATPKTAGLDKVICFDGYVTPAFEGWHFVGASYRHGSLESAPLDECREEIRERLCAWLPMFQASPWEQAQRRVCFRTSTPDRLPYVGSVPDLDWIRERALSRQPGSSLDDINQAAPNSEGLYLSLGHGSRGLLTCPIAGELIAREITGSPLLDLERWGAMTSPRRANTRYIRALAR